MFQTFQSADTFSEDTPHRFGCISTFDLFQNAGDVGHGVMLADSICGKRELRWLCCDFQSESGASRCRVIGNGRLELRGRCAWRLVFGNENRPHSAFADLLHQLVLTNNGSKFLSY